MQSNPATPRGWHRPVQPLALFAVGSVLLLIWLVVMTTSVWYFYEHWEARLTLLDQAVSLRLPAGMQAVAEITSPVRTKLNIQPLLHVPVKQHVMAEITDPLATTVRIDTTLPVDTSVTVDQVVPIKTVLNLSVRLKSWLPSIPVSMPVTLNVPVHLTVPIKASVPVALDLQVTGDLPKHLDIPIDAVFDVRPQVKGDIEVRLNRLTSFTLLGPVEPIPVTIERANVRVPFNLTLLKHAPR